MVSLHSSHFTLRNSKSATLGDLIIVVKKFLIGIKKLKKCLPQCYHDCCSPFFLLCSFFGVFLQEVDAWVHVELHWARMELVYLRRWAPGSAVVFFQTLALSWTGEWSWFLYSVESNHFPNKLSAHSIYILYYYFLFYIPFMFLYLMIYNQVLTKNVGWSPTWPCLIC